MVFPGPGVVNDVADRGARSARGWLLVLCLLLLVGQPLSLAFGLSAAIGALPIRGLPLAGVIVARLLVAAIGVGAGLALLALRPGSARMAQWSLGISAAMDTFVDTTPYYPHNRLPGLTPVVVALSIAYYAAWFMYLARSTRVKRTVPE